MLYKNFTHNEVSRIPISSFKDPIDTKYWGRLDAHRLGGDLYLVPGYKVMLAPTIIDHSDDQWIVFLDPEGPVFGTALDRIVKASKFLFPYVIDTANKVLTVSVGNETRLLMQSASYYNCPILTDTHKESIDRAYRLVSDYVKSIKDAKRIPACKQCEDKSVPHIIGHIERGDVSDKMISDFMTDDPENMLSILAYLLFPFFVDARGINTDITTDQLQRLRAAKWKYV